MRDKFKSGLKTLTDSGKNLTRFPLYVMVGEPGAGKTEAVRHSSIRFPQGINDLLQGVGGTYNMDWWFTNDAIILDTAGALLLEDSNKAQFEEFLELLKQHRPDYPITGLVLAIPADSLLLDDESGIEDKAGRIVEQFTVLQDALDLRYPVYVMVTKCDLVTGFREFFDAPGNDAFEPQMLGWSNPESLDRPFEPSRTAQLLEPIAERLTRIRERLLDEDWPSGEDLQRLDFLDAIYAFPGEFRRLFEPLGRYLEILFRPDRWKNQRPPFFRGIYFTSSLRQGAVLDQELAAALNMRLSELPDVSGYQTEKSLFLRDFFLEKLFREPGLVTRLTNIAAGLRNRLLRFYLVTASVLVLLLLAGWFASTRLDRRLAAERNLWKLANQTWENGTFLPLFERGGPDGAWTYAGDEPVMSSEFTRFAYQQKLAGEVEKGLGWGSYFAPLPAYRQLKHDRERAQIVIVEGSIIRPLLAAARERLRAQGFNAASRQQVEATLSLVELEAWIERQRRFSEEEDIRRIFGPLFRIAAPATFAAEEPAAMARGREIETELCRIIARSWRDIAGGDLDRMRWMSEGFPYPAALKGIETFTENKRRIDENLKQSEETERKIELEARNFNAFEKELWEELEAPADFEQAENRLRALANKKQLLDKLTESRLPATMGRQDYARYDARLAELLRDLPSWLGEEIAKQRRKTGEPDEAWVKLADRQRNYDPDNPESVATEFLWLAYVDPDPETGVPLYQKRHDALLDHYPLLDPEHKLIRELRKAQAGDLQPTLEALAKLVDDQAATAKAYPAAPKVEADPEAGPSVARAAAELNQRLKALSERGATITKKLDQGTKELLYANYLAGPFTEILMGHQSLIFRKPFGSRSPALRQEDASFTRAAQVVNALAKDFTTCDSLAFGAPHYQLEAALDPLRKKLGAGETNLRSRFEDLLLFRNAIADENNAVRAIPVTVGGFFVPDDEAVKRTGFLWTKKEKIVIPKGIHKVLIGRPQAEQAVDPGTQAAAPLSLYDPISISVRWQQAEAGAPQVRTGANETWGTLEFVLRQTRPGANRTFDILQYRDQKLSVTFNFPSTLPAASARHAGFVKE
jgi:hypothetical protein